jgi:hypothetical protein
MTLPAILLVSGVLLLFGAIEDQSVPAVIASIMRGERPPRKGEAPPPPVAGTAATAAPPVVPGG